MNNTKGQGGLGLVAGILLLVVGMAFTLVGIYISDQVITTINGSITAATDAQTTFDAVGGNVWSAFTLVGIAMIVIGAAIIISILKSAF